MRVSDFGVSGFQSGVPIRPSTFKLLPRRAQIGLSVPLLGGVSGVHGRGCSITGGVCVFGHRSLLSVVLLLHLYKNSKHVRH